MRSPGCALAASHFWKAQSKFLRVATLFCRLGGAGVLIAAEVGQEEHVAPVPAGGAAQPSQHVEGLRDRLATAPGPDLRVEGAADPGDDRPELGPTRRWRRAPGLGRRRRAAQEDGSDQPGDDPQASHHGDLSSTHRDVAGRAPGRNAPTFGPPGGPKSWPGRCFTPRLAELGRAREHDAEPQVVQLRVGDAAVRWKTMASLAVTKYEPPGRRISPSAPRAPDRPTRESRQGWPGLWLAAMTSAYGR